MSLVGLRSVLNHAMAWAARRGTIVKRPVEGCELPVESAGRRELHAYT